MRGRGQSPVTILLLLAFLLLPLCAAAGEIQGIDCTRAPAPIIKGHLGLGSTQSPSGQSIDGDSRSLYLNGKPWIPVSGEFHFSRYPREEWRDALLKMKAGGLDVVSTYVFWIHHEERPGEWDWSGQRSLRDFTTLCGELGMKVIVRLGPWSHGETRNGGFPDWVQARGIRRIRNLDPGFIALTEKLYSQIALQLAGLLWKDGGPVIGVQLDNECDNVPYLFGLKRVALKCGLDVPLYTITGWSGVRVPEAGLIPLFEAYADGYWEHNTNKYRTQFFFTPSPVVGDDGTIDFSEEEADRTDLDRRLARFPFLCCEMAGGMASSYDRRMAMAPIDSAAIAMVKLGCGNNMPGYYMYQGGINPDGKYSVLNEGTGVEDYYSLPVKDYDYMAPVGASGQVREHYHLLRQQHMFLREWGSDLAVMPAFFPAKRPMNVKDVQTLRWSVRSDGSRGFLFFNNHQRFGKMQPKEAVQFSLKMKEGEILLPSSPVSFPTGVYGLWPVRMDCAGVNLTYATAQPLCRLDDEAAHWFFFAATEGISPEFMIGDKESRDLVQNITPGTGIAFSRVAPDMSTVNFVVLAPDQARQLWKLPVAGRTRTVLSSSALLPDSEQRLRIETIGDAPAALEVFPPVRSALLDGAAVAGVQDGIFLRFAAPVSPPPAVDIAFEPIRPGVEVKHGKQVYRLKEKSWTNAAVWRLRLPADSSLRDFLMRVGYSGDAARVYAGGKLVMDNFCNDLPFDMALRRIPAERWADMEIHILPPARLMGISAIPQRQWIVDWE